jgi:hypothetical protein
VTPERRYALDALFDALGLPFDEGVAVPPGALDEVFGLLTLAAEQDTELDQHGRPVPPAKPPGPKVAEIAAGLGLERRGYPGGERFLVALTHDIDLLGAGLRGVECARARRTCSTPWPGAIPCFHWADWARGRRASSSRARTIRTTATRSGTDRR